MSLPSGWLAGILFLVLAITSSPNSAAAQHSGFYYTVREKDTLSVIAGRFGLPALEIAKANRLSTNVTLSPGSRLWIPRKSGTNSDSSYRPSPSTRSESSPRRSPSPTARASPGVYVVRKGDSLWKISRQFSLTVEELARRNGIAPNDPLEVGQRLVIVPAREIPGGGLRAPSAPSQSGSSRSSSSSTSSSPAPSRHGFIWPVEGHVIKRHTVRSDELHTGINIGVPKGTEVRASKSGQVVYAGDTIPYYGKMIIISHAGGMATCYAMNDRLLVRKGQSVRRGQVIARSGDSGRGSEPYLHFEVRRDGEAVDPEPYLP